MRGQPDTTVIIHSGAHCAAVLLVLTVIAAERVKGVLVCVL